jgi:hypothetical protein
MSKTQCFKRAMLVLILVTTLAGCALPPTTGPGIADSSESASPPTSQMSRWRSELADYSPWWPIVSFGGITLAILTLTIILAPLHQETEQNVDQKATPPIVADFHVGLGGESRRYTAEQNVDLKAVPPIVAEFLVGLFAKSPRHRNGLLQNLEEEFDSNLANGATVRRARRKYWAAALNSIGPQLLAAAKRIGIIGLIADYARRLLH